MTTRRGFLTGILALGAAPAIVRAASLMPIWVPPQELVIPTDQFVFFIHPTWEEATRELIGCGSATVVISREVLRHG